VISRWAPRAVVAGGLAANPAAESAVRASHRFAAPRHNVGFWIALWTAVVATEFVALLPMVVADEPTAGYRVVFRLVGGAFAACGLIAWHRRPDSRSGLLMVATGFGLLVEPVFVQLEPGALRTVGDLFEDAWGIPIIALLLTFLSGGRLASRVDRVLVGVFVLALVAEFARHVVLVREGNFLFVRENAAIAEGLVAASAVLVSVGCITVAVVIGARWKAASAPRRRAMWPSVAGISCLMFFAIAQQSTPSALQWLAACSLLAVPAAFLAGLLRSRLARGGLAELFRELSGMRGPALQAALARTLGDPTLALAHRLPDSLGHADADGGPVLVPPVTADRATAPIRLDGEEIAVLVYDSLLDDDPELVEAVSAAAAIALENERLQAVSEARLVELKASRERIVTAGDAERRRIERDLHDGAQQRMVAIALQLRLAEGQIHEDPALAKELVQTASSELALSLRELRELARGIHPAVLEHGLSAALDSLAVRSPVPTTVTFETTDRLPEPLEFAAYFVASEALANVAKYSRATRVTMRVWRSRGMASIEIADNGVGGADDANGSGLRGLTDRVEALDGRLRIRSTPGVGTIVTAEMPCGS
jgi:signal transduction histidine kinase